MVQYLHSAWFLDGKISLLTFNLYHSCSLVYFLPTFTIGAILSLLAGEASYMDAYTLQKLL